jgi:hypothetical protein
MSRPCQCLGFVIRVVLGFYPGRGRGQGAALRKAKQRPDDGPTSTATCGTKARSAALGCHRFSPQPFSSAVHEPGGAP